MAIMSDLDANNQKFTAFLEKTCIARGSIESVVVAAKELLDQGKTSRIAIFSDDTGETIEIDFRGTLNDILSRLIHHPMLPTQIQNEPVENSMRRPGRPKLGVISREVSLLPRHWDWLAKQSGGASNALRRLVEEARKKNEIQDRQREIESAVHRFMWDMAGNEPHFEDVTRAFYVRDFQTMGTLMKDWPTDVRVHIKRLVQRLAPSAPPSS
jgi:hypothetical protein